MKRFRTIFNFELSNYFKSKSFTVVTLLLVLLIGGVMFFPRISEAMRSGDSSGADERPVMLISVDADVSDTMEPAAIGAMFSAAFPENETKITDANEEKIKESVLSGKVECAFILNAMDSYTYYVNNLSIYDSNTAVADELLRDICRLNGMAEAGVDPAEAADIMSTQIKGEIVSLGKDQAQNYFYTYIMIFALYMVILLYGQMVSMSVATEKSSRAMELLITSAKPVSMMFGKVIAACLAGLVQLLAAFGSALLFYNINESYWSDNPIVSSIFNIPSELLGYMLLFFILGFFIYAFMYGAIGSTVSKLEDINTAVMPLTFIFIAAFMIVMFSMGSGSVDTLLMKICSYIPLTSPMAMFTRIAMSSVPWYEIAASTGILVVSVFGVGIVSAKIYRVGVLLYGTSPKPSAILKAIRKA